MVHETLFKRSLIWGHFGPPVWWSRTIYSILKEGIWNNIICIHVKLYEIWTSGSGDVVKEKVYGCAKIDHNEKKTFASALATVRNYTVELATLTEIFGLWLIPAPLELQYCGSRAALKYFVCKLVFRL